MPIDLSNYYESDDDESENNSTVESNGLDLSSYYATEQPIAEPTSYIDDIGAALSSGYRNMKSGVAGTAFMAGATDAESTAESFVNTIKKQPETPTYFKKMLDKISSEIEDVSEAEGFWDTAIETLDATGQIMLEAVTNPKAMGYGIAESAAQALPAIGLGGAGAALGTAISPGVGTVAGLSIGSGLGTYAVESGNHLKSLVVRNLHERGLSMKDVAKEDVLEVLESDEFLDWAESEAQKRGIAVGAVEGLFAAFGGKVLSDSAKKASAFKGIGKTAEKAPGTKGAIAKGVGIETLGEAAGEFAGQTVTEGEYAPEEIVTEALFGLGQSVATTATGAAAGLAKPKPQDALTAELEVKDDISFDALPDDFKGDALDAEVQRGDPLAEGLGRIEETQAESIQQEVVDALAIINSDPALKNQLAEIQARGGSPLTAIKELYEQAEQVDHPSRTDAQKALVKMGRDSINSAKSPIDNLRAQSGEVEFVEVPTLTDEQRQEAEASLPEVLRTFTPPVKMKDRDEDDVKGTTTEDQIPPVSQEVLDAQPVSEQPEITKDIQTEVQEEAAPRDTATGRRDDVAAKAERIKEVQTKIDDAKQRMAREQLRKTPEIYTADEFRQTAKKPDVAAEIEAAAADAQLSPKNDMPEPSLQQLKDGEYRKGHVKIQEMPIAIENPKGSTRRGKAPDGKEWATKMKDHYGYVEFTEGADGGPIDVFIGDNPQSDKIFVVDQVNPTTGKFDEHKVVIGANNANQAKMFYNRNYDKNWQGLGNITEMSVEEFKQWSQSDAAKQPAAQIIGEQESAIDSRPDTRPAEQKTDQRSKSAVKPHRRDRISTARGGVLPTTDTARREKVTGREPSRKVEPKAGVRITKGAKKQRAAEQRGVEDSWFSAPRPSERVSRPSTTVKAEVKEGTPTKTRAGKVESPDGPTTISKKSDLEKSIKTGIHNTLSDIKKFTANESYKAIIDKISPHISDSVTIRTVKVNDLLPNNVVKKLDKSRAIASINYKTGKTDIYIKDDTFTHNGLNEETIIHESIHAATSELIHAGKQRRNQNTPIGKAVRDLQELQNMLMKYINERIVNDTATDRERNFFSNIVVSNTDEMVAWGLTNKEFQNFLKGVPVTKKQSVWSKFTQTVAKLLGLGSKEHNALVELLERTSTVLDTDYRQDIKLRHKMLKIKKGSISFKKAEAVHKQQFDMAQLKTERANLEYQKAHRLDIKAGKRLKEVDSEIEILQQKIDDTRSKDSYFDEGSGGVFDTVDKITVKPKNMQTIRERMSQWVADHVFSFDDIRQFFGRKVTDIYAIERMEREAFGERLSAEKSPTALSLMAKNAQVAASIATTKHSLKLNDGVIVIDKDKPGLEQILEPVAKLGNKYLRLWEAWAVVKRSERLATEGRENFVLDKDIERIKNYVDSKPNLKALFEGTHTQYQEFNRSMLQLAIDAGWINEQDAFGGYRLTKTVNGKKVYRYKPNGAMFATASEALAKAPKGFKAENVNGWYHDDYVPFNRLNDVDQNVKGLSPAGKIGQVRKGVIGLKGGVGQIPVLENITKNISFLVSGTLRTIAMQKTVDMAEGIAVERLSEDGQPPMINRESAEKALESVGISKEGITDAEAQRWQKMLSAVRPQSADSVVVYQDGRPTHYRVLDPHLLSALKNIGPQQSKTWLRVLGFPTRVLSGSITKLPAFLVKNLVRETQNAYVINKEAGLNPYKTLKTAVKNFKKLLKTDNPEMLSMMAGGFVNFNSYYQSAPEDVRSRLTKMGVNKSATRKILESPWTATKNLWDAYMRVAVASEHANRLSVRDSFLKAGATEAEANYQALDVLNFSRRGDGMVMDILLATIPFLNPRIQGLDRLYRGGKENWRAMAMKAGLMSVGAVSLAVWNWENNEEEMDKLKEEDKDLWYHFWVDGEHYRIPKGFEIGQIAGTLPEKIVEQVMTDNPESVGAAFRRFMMMTFGLQYPQAIKPAFEIAQNEDFFRQRPIVNFGMQFAPAKMQYDTWTNKLMIDIAQSMPDSAPNWAKSPVKLQHLFKAYLGPMGSMVLEGANDMYEATGNAPDMPTKALSQRYFIRDFYRSGVERTSRHMNRFYSMVGEVGEISIGLKKIKQEGDRTEYRTMMVEQGDKLKVRKSLNRISKRMRKFNKRITEIMKSGVMTSDAKFAEIQKIQKQKNELARYATDKYWHIFN
jgi:hypothetical protein